MSYINLITSKLSQSLGHKPTADQSKAIAKLAIFLADDQVSSCFILNGFAGTGKTSLVGGVIRALGTLDVPYLLTAPTGRAAKVLARASGQAASTLHRTIYEVMEREGGGPSFRPRANENLGAVVVVDEASMVGNSHQGAGFASGQQLLADLIHFVRQAEGCRLLLVGDVAQLPPVGETRSPALNPSVMRLSFPTLYTASLTQVVRQEQESGILHYATILREMMAQPEIVLPKFTLGAFPDFQALDAENFSDTLFEYFGRSSCEETIILCRSNRRANEYNTLIRRQIFDREEDLIAGDRLMICRNSYHWTRGIKHVPFLANGDMIRLTRVWDRHEKYGRHYADIRFETEDYGGGELDALATFEVLHANSPAMPQEELLEIYRASEREILEQNNGKPDHKRLREDPYVNALQLKYGYAVTCHKAQGGQWETVMIDLELWEGIPTDLALLRWIYTAITRATRRIFLIAPPPRIVAPPAQ